MVIIELPLFIINEIGNFLKPGYIKSVSQKGKLKACFSFLRIVVTKYQSMGSFIISNWNKINEDRYSELFYKGNCSLQHFYSNYFSYWLALNHYFKTWYWYQIYSFLFPSWKKLKAINLVSVPIWGNWGWLGNWSRGLDLQNGVGEGRRDRVKKPREKS